MTPSRVLVTGATSRLGQAVGRCLRRHGHIAHATSRTKLDETVLSLFEQIHHLDLSDPAGLGRFASSSTQSSTLLPLTKKRRVT
jgi:NAD(P)-dependent dehydrogenase (short-subunit alcohol dehydrogenase family)